MSGYDLPKETSRKQTVLSSNKNRTLGFSLVSPFEAGLTDAGVDRHVVLLVYVSAYAHDVEEDECAHSKRHAEYPVKDKGAIRKLWTTHTYLKPRFPHIVAPDLPASLADEP
jgi:hypothetical protein